MNSDTEFLILLSTDLKKEGGICKLESLIALNSSLKKYLRDRKLLSFIEGIIFKSVFYSNF